MKKYEIKPMTIDDYEGLHALWMTIHGFGIRSIDDSKEGVKRFLKRNPDISAAVPAIKKQRIKAVPITTGPRMALTSMWAKTISRTTS